MKGACKCISKGYHGGVWDHTKRLLDAAVMGMHDNVLGLSVAKSTHVCTLCWRKLALGYDVKARSWKTIRAVTHATQ